VAIHHEVHGQTDAAAPAVLLSAGLGGAGAFWTPQVGSLAERYRVVLYDHRGTGQSGGPLPDPYAIAGMADDAIEVLNDLGIARCHVMGHALGGLVGLELALRSPARVRSLVLVNAWAKLDAHTAYCFDVRLDLLRHVGPEAYVRAQPLFLFPAPWLSQNAERLAREHAHGVAHFQGTATLLARIAALRAFDVAARLGDIRCPALVMAARDDMLVPWTASRDLADGIPDAELWLTPEGGHACNVTDPAAFNAALRRFLDAQGAYP